MSENKAPRKVDIGEVQAVEGDDPLHGLSPEERRYVNVFVEDGEFCHKRTAKLIGRTKPIYSQRVRDAIDAVVSRVIPSENEFLVKVRDWVWFNPARHGKRWRYFDEVNRVWKVDWDYINESGIGHAIKSVKNDRSGNEIIEWHSQTEAANLLAKAMGLTTESTRSVNINLANASVEELRRMIDGS